LAGVTKDNKITITTTTNFQLAVEYKMRN